MSNNRDSLGNFTDGSALGAPTWEQQAAGVNPTDSIYTAQQKITAHQISMQQGYAPTRAAQPTCSAGSSRTFWNLVAVVLLLVAGLSLYEKFSHYAGYTTYYIGSNGRGLSSPPDESYRKQTLERFAPAFRADAPLNDAFKYCTKRNCYLPDWSAFMRLKQWAARPELFESDLCNAYIRANSDSADMGVGVEKIFVTGKDRVYDRSEKTCVAQNMPEVRKAVKKSNNDLLMMLGAGFVAAIIVLFYINRKV